MSAFQIVGYDKKTELLAIQHHLSADHALAARLLVRMQPEDDGYGCYPLDPDAARQIGGWLEWPLRLDLYDWFLEPSDET